MSAFINQVGLNINEDIVQLVELINKDDICCLENVDEEFFEESILVDSKEAKYIHILQNAFNEIVLRKPLNSQKISVALPPSYFKVFEVPIDKNLTKNDLNEYIKWEFTKLFPFEKSDEHTFQKLVLNPLHYESFKRVIVYTIPIKILKRIHKFCSRNNLHLRYIDNAHISAISFIHADISIPHKLSVYIENDKISVIMFSNNNIVFEKNKTYKSIPEISELVKQIIDEIEERELNSKSLEKIYIFGNSVTNELKSNIESSINLAIGEVKPFLNLKITENLNENKFVTENSLRFVSASAMALRIGS